MSGSSAAPTPTTPLAAAIAALPAETLILDGEVCAFDQALVSHMRLLRDAEPGEIATPPMFGAFDILHVNGRDLRALPLRERRALLEHEPGCYSPFGASPNELARGWINAR